MTVGSTSTTTPSLPTTWAGDRTVRWLTSTTTSQDLPSTSSVSYPALQGDRTVRWSTSTTTSQDLPSTSSAPYLALQGSCVTKDPSCLACEHMCPIYGQQCE